MDMRSADDLRRGDRQLGGQARGGIFPPGTGLGRGLLARTGVHYSGGRAGGGVDRAAVAQGCTRTLEHG